MTIKPGDAVADHSREELEKLLKEAELAALAVEVRADRRSQDFEEDSAVILQEARERQRKKESDPPSQRGPWAILTIPLRIKSWQQVAGFAIAALLVAVLVKWGLKLF